MFSLLIIWSSTADTKVPIFRSVRSEVPIVGWPPTKDRDMKLYIRPEEDTFLLRPSVDYFTGCELLIIVHSNIEAFEQRRVLRETWLSYISNDKVTNVSSIFLVGNQNIHQNLTQETR